MQKCQRLSGKNAIGNNAIGKNVRDKTYYTSLVLYLSLMKHDLKASWEKMKRCHKSTIYDQINSPTLYIGRV